jgi:hypothetical protein
MIAIRDIVSGGSTETCSETLIIKYINFMYVVTYSLFSQLIFILNKSVYGNFHFLWPLIFSFVVTEEIQKFSVVSSSVFHEVGDMFQHVQICAIFRT